MWYNYKIMIIILITIGLIIGTSYLLKISKNKPHSLNYILVLIGGVITFIFMPLIFTLYGNLITSGILPTAVQLSSTIFGIYFIVWAISKLIKIKKLKNSLVEKNIKSNGMIAKKTVNKYLILGLIFLGFIFYWFQLRPMSIKRDCSWVITMVPADSGVTKEEAEINKEIFDRCTKSNWVCDKPSGLGRYGLFLNSKERAPSPERLEKFEATENEYNLCLREHGL